MPAPLPSACPPILQQFPHNAKHNPPLAPSANGGLTRESDFPKCLPPDCFGITVRMPGIRGNRETQGYAPIHKTSVHADHCSGFFQNGLSRAAQHSEVCFVFGDLPEFARSAEKALDSERCGNLLDFLAHGTHSFPMSILYNIFLDLSMLLCNFNIFTKSHPPINCNLHKQPFTFFMVGGFLPGGLKTRK